MRGSWGEPRKGGQEGESDKNRSIEMHKIQGYMKDSHAPVPLQGKHGWSFSRASCQARCMRSVREEACTQPGASEWEAEGGI